MADAEPPFEQRLRAEGAEQRELHGGGHEPPDTEAAGEGRVNLTKQALRDLLPGGVAGKCAAPGAAGILRSIRPKGGASARLRRCLASEVLRDVRTLDRKIA